MRPSSPPSPPPPHPHPFAPEPDASSGPAFLDPQALIDASLPRPARLSGLPMLTLIALAIVIFSASSDSPLGRALSLMSPVLFFAYLATLVIVGRRGAARMSAEAQAVTALDELVQLRRWPEAADLAMRLFARPMRSPERRMHALAGLASVLTRYHRFEDARVVHDYLLERFEDGDDDGSSLAMQRRTAEPMPDPSMAHSIRVARAMGLLREDRLVDADRAMADLRREVNQARDEVRRASGPEAAGKVRSAGLVLLDLYRDIKTGHFDEAVDGFNKALPALREQLGGRVADAWVLYATALHALGRGPEAQVAYSNATSLVLPVELHRRYPETAKLAAAYQPWKMPAGA